MQVQQVLIREVENGPDSDEDVVVPLMQQKVSQQPQAVVAQQPQPVMQQQAAPMNLAQEEEKNEAPMDGVFSAICAGERPLKGHESDGEMYYVPSTQSTPNVICNASDIHEEQDQQEESAYQPTTMGSARRQKREKAKAAKVAERQLH